MDDISLRARKRQNRNAEIISIAERLFSEAGYDAISMDQVAGACGITKRTLYQYFPAKEDLYLAVTLKSFREMYRYLESAVDESQSGGERLRQVCLTWYSYFREFPANFRFISDWSHVIGKSRNGEASLAQVHDYNRKMFNNLGGLIRLGMADGSLRPDLSVESTVGSLVFLITGFFAQYAISGESYTRFLKLDPERFCLEALEMILASLKPAQESGQKKNNRKRS